MKFQARHKVFPASLGVSHRELPATIDLEQRIAVFLSQQLPTGVY